MADERQLRVAPPFNARQVEALCRVTDNWPRPPVLIGAAALACSIPMTWRHTSDLDIALIGDASDSKERLQKLGFQRVPNQEHRWQSSNGVAFDILPATQLQVAKRKLVWPESGFEMSLLGIDLALKHNFPVSLGQDSSLLVAKAPALIIAKMVSWQERPHERQRDLADIAHVLKDYLDDDDDRRWDDARLADHSFENQSAAALGHDIAAIARPAHRRAIDTFLASVSDPDKAPAAVMSAALTSANGAKQLAELLDGFRQGLDEPSHERSR